MLLILISALAAEPAPASTAPRGPEPVYELAQKDLTWLRSARTFQFASMTLPAVFLAGAFAKAQLVPDSDGDIPVTPQSVAAESLYTVGGFGMIAAVTAFHHATLRSRKHLREQGLSVAGTPKVVVPTLAVIGVTVAYGASNVRTPSEDLRARALVAGLGLYGIGMGIATLQLESNRRARKNAGWLGMVPTYDGRTTGLAVGGRW